MFTGIVTHIGTIRTIEPRGDLRVTIGCDLDLSDIVLGASIACSGACLTVVDKGDDWFAVDVSAETRSKTVPGRWTEGTVLNLERALKLGEELGGHLVTGHVDGLARVTGLYPDGDSRRVALAVPARLAPYLAVKGSVTLDGVSLTINEVRDGDSDCNICVNIVPHTANHTTLGKLREDSQVNVEIDLIARYLHRMNVISAAG